MSPAPAQYFPVTSEPLRMKAGLFPLGTDFGNGVADQLHFQRDEQAPRYLDAKRLVPATRHQVVAAPKLEPVHDAALRWLEQTLDAEQPGARLVSHGSLAERYAALSLSVQEDLALMHRGTGEGRALMAHVSFPSGWRPERLADASFLQIHTPVPQFGSARLATSMMEAMIDRGPFVRFVWTVCADDALDHHPEEGQRAKWTSSTPRGWLRVERQLTSPLKAVDAAIFLIRTYLTPLEDLSGEQRATLAAALEAMPEDVARYKSLFDGRPRMLELLRGQP